MWETNILTTIEKYYSNSILKRRYNKSCKINIYKIQNDISKNRIDSPPYGGGCGMVIRADAIDIAINKFCDMQKPIIYFSPRGKVLDQKMALKYSQNTQGVNIVCGRFEGIDERIIEEYNIEELSIGDYILSSGDIAALVFLDVCSRLIPGVLGNSASLIEESFGNNKYENLLEYPHYTRPKIWKGRIVPSVLLSGHHQDIKDWRLSKSESITKQRRPDLWKNYIKKIDNE